MRVEALRSSAERKVSPYTCACTCTHTVRAREINGRPCLSPRFAFPILPPPPSRACTRESFQPRFHAALLRIPDRYPQKSMAMVGKNSSRSNLALENSRRGAEFGDEIPRPVQIRDPMDASGDGIRGSGFANV